MEKVRERCDRATKALDAAGVLYAVVGGNAVANWVASVKESAMRNTRDVDILIRRDDLDAARAAMEGVGFEYAITYGIHLFLDGPSGEPSEGVHLLFAGEKVKPTDPVEAPLITESVRVPAFNVVALEALVRMKLVAFRRKDQVHLQDMVGLGMIDESWPAKYPEPLAERLREILADPDG